MKNFKSLIIITALVLISACGKSGGGSNNNANVALNSNLQEGGVTFTQPLTICGGGAINIKPGDRMSWSQVRRVFGGMEGLRQTTTEFYPMYDQRTGQLYYSESGERFSALNLGQIAASREPRNQIQYNNGQNNGQYNGNQYNGNQFDNGQYNGNQYSQYQGR